MEVCWAAAVCGCVLVAAAALATLTHMARCQAIRHREGRPGPVRALSQDLMRRAKTQFGEFLMLDLAESTRKTCGVQQEQYEAFCGHIGAAQQLTAKVLARFVVGLAVHGYYCRTRSLIFDILVCSPCCGVRL